MECTERFRELITKPTGLGGWIGMPHKEYGCLVFLRMALRELGIETTDRLLAEEKHWKKVQGRAQFGDVVLFRGLPFSERHVGLMLDHRHAIQSSESTNGVGRIDIKVQPWCFVEQTMYRHESCC